MKNKILCILSLALISVIILSSCANPPYVSNFADFTYMYEGSGAGGVFSITINDDGTFSYLEGLDSSYIGVGTWELEGNRIKLTDNGDSEIINYFTYEKGYIIYSSRKSTGFKHVDLKNGERFQKIVPTSETGEPVING